MIFFEDAISWDEPSHKMSFTSWGSAKYVVPYVKTGGKKGNI